MVRIAAIVLGVLLSFGANAQSVRLKNLHPENDRMRFFNEVLFCNKEGEIVSHEEAARLILDWAKNQTKIQDDTIIVIPLLPLLKKTYPAPLCAP